SAAPHGRPRCREPETASARGGSPAPRRSGPYPASDELTPGEVGPQMREPDRTEVRSAPQAPRDRLEQQVRRETVRVAAGKAQLRIAVADPAMDHLDLAPALRPQDLRDARDEDRGDLRRVRTQSGRRTKPAHDRDDVMARAA